MVLSGLVNEDVFLDSGIRKLNPLKLQILQWYRDTVLKCEQIWRKPVCFKWILQNQSLVVCTCAGMAWQSMATAIDFAWFCFISPLVFMHVSFKLAKRLRSNMWLTRLATCSSCDAGTKAVVSVFSRCAILEAAPMHKVYTSSWELQLLSCIKVWTVLMVLKTAPKSRETTVLIVGGSGPSHFSWTNFDRFFCHSAETQGELAPASAGTKATAPPLDSCQQTDVQTNLGKHTKKTQNISTLDSTCTPKQFCSFRLVKESEHLHDRWKRACERL